MNSPARATDTDVLIVGAGLPGLALAIALRGSGLSVALVDRKRPAVESASDVDRDDAWDSRVYAISPGNARFLDSIGVWPRMDVERLGPVETMRIFGDRPEAQIDFSAFDSGLRALAWIVEQRELMSATLDAWADGPTETLWCESPPLSLERERVGQQQQGQQQGQPQGQPQVQPQVQPQGQPQEQQEQQAAQQPWQQRQRLTLADGTQLTARLVVGADGLQSWTRQQSGIPGEPKPYGHTAVVANFTMTGRHHGRAWQWFQPDGGALAWLPLAGQRMSIVWSVPSAAADALLALDDARFVHAVAAAGASAASAVGKLTLLTSRATFPLSKMRLSTPIGERLVLIGDAAHGIHPLAGQGLNLGYGDVHALARALNERMPISDPGDRLLLSRYAAGRAFPNLAMSLVTDGLWHLFKAPFAGVARNHGMAVFNRFPALKAVLMQPAMR